MRELTSLEMKAVSGGLYQPRPIGRHPLARLIVGLILFILHRKRPTAPALGVEV
jgi:hypothetical protein